MGTRRGLRSARGAAIGRKAIRALNDVVATGDTSGGGGIMAAIATERRRYTLPEFLALLEELELAGSQDWYDIIGGELVAHASPVDPHMRAAMACRKLLLDAQWAGFGRAGNDRTVVLDYRGTSLPVAHAYKPDAFFVATDGRAILDHPETPSVVGAPDIVVEVLSPTTARFDRPPKGKKFLAYEEAGVRYYWVADPVRRTLATFERRGERLVETAVLRPGHTLRCPLFPELGIKVVWHFGTP
jgi:Uma2 family endonuclease